MSLASTSDNPTTTLTGQYRNPAILIGLAVVILYGPTYYDLANTIWVLEEQSYGPVLLISALWLAFHDRAMLLPLLRPYRSRSGWILFVVALLLYFVGRSQDIWFVEVISIVPLAAGLALLYFGPSSLKFLWIPLVLLAFTAPLPGDLVALLTAPLKAGVSLIAAEILHSIGYSVARTGVILTIGQYQLLVADACAGLTSMLTLEAMGLIYLKLMNYQSRSRNIALGLLLIPIAFAANVVRVIILVLVTYHFGDEAGQGFVHSLAGLSLFTVATAFMILTDSALGHVLKFSRHKVKV